jgi:outer membrane protein assembly factor BamB
VTPSAAAAAVALCLSACQADVEEDVRTADLTEVWPDATPSSFITQLDNGDVVGIDADTAQVKWRYRHFGVPRLSFIDLPRSRLVCDPRPANEDLLYLVFTDSLVALSPKTATVRWRMKLRVPMPRSACPTVTPDSGIAMVAMRGRTTAKMSSTGAALWTYWFPQNGSASSSPVVIPDSGDTLARVGDNLYSVSPAGKLNWRRPVLP